MIEGILEVKQGNDVTHHPIDFTQHKHWDYAYACTVHGAQGITQHRAIFHIAVPEKETEKSSEKVFKDMAKVFMIVVLCWRNPCEPHELKFIPTAKNLQPKPLPVNKIKTSAIESLEKTHTKEISKSISR